MSRPSDTALAHLWLEPDEPVHSGGIADAGSPMESAISIWRPSSGDVFLVPIPFHVRGVDQVNVLMMDI